MTPLSQTGYKTAFNQRQSKQSTQKLPKIHRGRNSMSMANTETELLSQNLERLNKKMKVEVSHNKKFKRLFIVVQPKQTPHDVLNTAQDLMSDDQPPQDISGIDAMSTTPYDDLSPPQRPEKSNIEQSELSSRSTPFQLQACIGQCSKTFNKVLSNDSTRKSLDPDFQREIVDDSPLE